MALSMAIAATSCKDPTKGKPQATVGAPSIESKLSEFPGAIRYQLSGDESRLTFVGTNLRAKNEGRFATLHGTILLVDNDPVKSFVQVDIDTGSLVIQPADLAKHLRSKDFLDVERFPQATFSSTRVVAGGDNGATHTVTGNFSLHGVTKSITLPATIRVNDPTIDVDGEFSINRKDFGIVYPGAPDNLINDRVLIQLKLQAKKT